MIDLTNQQVNTVKQLVEAQVELDFPFVAFKKVQVEKDGRVIVEFEHGVKPITDYRKQLEIAELFVTRFVNKAVPIDLGELNGFFKDKVDSKFNKDTFEKALKNAKFKNQDAIDLARSADMFMKSTLNVVNNANKDANLTDTLGQTIDEYMQAQYGVTLQEYNSNNNVRIQVLHQK